MNSCFCLIVKTHIDVCMCMCMCVCVCEYVCVSKNKMFDRLSNLSVFVQGKVELERSQGKIKDVVKCCKISAMYYAAILCPRAEPCHKSFTMLSVL